MNTDCYRFRFAATVLVEEIEATLLLAVLATEALYGESQTRLDAGHALDLETNTLVIDASTPVGRDLNRLFVNFAQRDFCQLRPARLRPSEFPGRTHHRGGPAGSGCSRCGCVIRA